QAKLQNDGGRVKTGPRAVARGCFVDLVTVGHVLSRAVTLGLLVDYQEDKGRFECVIYWFAADQAKGGAAFRKAKQRGGLPVDPDDTPPLSRSVLDGHDESRPVPECPPTGQDRTDTSATQRNSNAELRSAVVEVFAYWQERCNHRQAAASDDRLSLIGRRIKERQRIRGGDMHAAILDCRRAVDGAALAPFVDERGKRHDGIGLVFRSNEKLEDFMDRVSLPVRGADIVPIRSEREARQARRLAALHSVSSKANQTEESA
ncbi:MAG: hypothetical protein ACRDNK_22370, partial [Solirubrobacteraceae bacterium]